jgi:outer membrane receptor protein involved in Fe transport
MKRYLLALVGLGVFAGPAVAQEPAASPSPAPQEQAPEDEVVKREEIVVVTASKVESTVINAPATMTVVTSEVLSTSPAQNYGDLLRAVPGMNVVQTSARDINIVSRQSTGTLSASQLTLLDGRSIYLDFFGMVLWDFLPSNTNDIKQIEVVRGPASAVWGANALTGVVNIITKTPREGQGFTAQLQGGFFDRDVGSTAGEDSGKNYGANVTYAGAPNETWSYRLAAGYYNSDPYARPVGTVPVDTHPLDSSIRTGGAPYPADRDPQRPGEQVFNNTETSQPKVDLRLDQDMTNGARIIYSAGYAGTEGIIHTGIGPFRIQSGSRMGYGRVAFSKGALRIATFANLVDAEAPNLLLVDPATNQPVQLNFKTETYDLELGHSSVLGGKHVLSYGGNLRRNNFDVTLTPNAENRTEMGAYLQDEIFFDKWRFAIGGRVDKFGNIDDPVFSPRVTAMFKPGARHSIRASYNRAFRSPSSVNNFLDQQIVVLTPDLSPLRPFLPPSLQPFATRLPLVVNNVGNQDLVEESLTAYELAYTGSVGRTTFGFAVYQNDQDDNINFTQLSPGMPGYVPYTVTDPPPPAGGIQIPPAFIGVLAAIPPQLGGPIVFPKVAATYLNLGPLRQRGVELSLDHAFTSNLTGFANYSWQDEPEILDEEEGQIRFPVAEVTVPATNRFNLGMNFINERFLGSLSLNYSDAVFWTDVLSREYHGATDSYTLVNGSFGVKWAGGKVTTTLKANNILNQEVQQHIYGDIMKMSLVGELKIHF